MFCLTIDGEPWRYRAIRINDEGKGTGPEEIV